MHGLRLRNSTNLIISLSCLFISSHGLAASPTLSEATDEKLFYSLDVTNQTLNDASKELYSGVVSKGSAYKSRSGELVIPNQYEADYPSEGVVLGQGWKMDKMAKTPGVCVQFEPYSVGGQMATISSTKIFSSEQLKNETTTSINANAKGGFGGFSASGSHKSSFTYNSKVESSFDTRLLKAQVVDGVDFVSPMSSGSNSESKIVLTSFALKALKDGNWETFRSYCGDTYVSAIERGAEMFVVSTQDSYSAFKEVVSKKTTSVSASYLGNSANVDSSYASLKSGLNVSKQSKFDYYHSAHRGLYIPASVDEVAQAVRMLGDSTSQNKSFPFKVQLTSYAQLPDFKEAAKHLKVPMVDRLQVYKERLESVKGRLEHMLGYTLVGSKDADCAPAKAMECVRRSNLVLYYLGNEKPSLDLTKNSWGSTEQIEQSRKYYSDLLNALERELVVLQREISSCYDSDVSNEQCLATFDGKYSDYFYLALLPLPKVAQLYVDDSANNLVTDLQGQAKALEEEYKTTRARTFKKLKTCRVLGKKIKDKNICGYTNVIENCPKFSSAKQCKAIRQKQSALQRQIELAGIDAIYASIAEARYDYYIGSRMKYRKDVGAIDVALNQEQIEYLKDTIAAELTSQILPVRCELAVEKMPLLGAPGATISGTGYGFGGVLGENPCKAKNSVYSRIVDNGERLRFVYVFDEDQHKKKLNEYAQGYMSEAEANMQTMEDLLRRAIDNRAPQESVPVIKVNGGTEQPLMDVFTVRKSNFESAIKAFPLQPVKEADLDKAVEQVLEGDFLDEYRRLEEENEDLTSMAEGIRSYVNANKSRSPDELIATPLSLAEKSANLAINIKESGEATNGGVIEPVLSLYSLEEDYVLDVQSY